MTTDIVNQSLKQWRHTVIQGAGAQDKRSDTNIPLSPEKLDMAAYTFSSHMKEGCALELDPFWGLNNIRQTLLKYRIEEHSACHCASCFKRAENVGFFFHSCQLLLHVYMRIEMTTTQMKLCGFV
jgi:hypothetical protein